MTTVKEDLVTQAVEHLRVCILAEDARRGEYEHVKAQGENAFQSFRYAQEKTVRARIQLDKHLGASGTVGSGILPGPSSSSGRPT